MRDQDTITLGSGKFYMKEYTDTVPTKEELFVEAYRAGFIKGGATLEYTQEIFEEKDDLGYVSKFIITEEGVIFRAGLLTWNGDTLAKLIDRCKVVVANGLRVAKIGGKGNEQGKYWAIGFHHEDPVDGDVWLILVGRNSAGLSIAFATDNGTLIEPEFKAMPHDDEGTLIQIIEQTADGSSGGRENA